MLKAGTLVFLTREGAEKVMRTWDETHPFHRLAKFLTEHSDGQILIKKDSERGYCEITLAPETVLKYKEEIEQNHLSIHLANWREEWFKIAGQLTLPQPKYHIGEKVFVKDCGKYYEAEIEKIEPIWTCDSYFSPCKFKTWGYHVVGHGVYPFPEEKVVPTLQHEKEKEELKPKFQIGEKVEAYGELHKVIERRYDKATETWHYDLKPLKGRQDVLRFHVPELHIKSLKFKTEDVKIGVPEDFYPNEYLVEINRGFVKPEDENKIPKTIPCWGCDEQAVVCGYPYYICPNNHLTNVETGEKWVWKSTDEVYHSLLKTLGKTEITYQKLFHPTSKAKKYTEADKIGNELINIGETLYDKLNVQEEDKYHWGKDVLKHHAGLRFAINMLNRAVFMRTTKWLFTNETPSDGWHSIYERQAEHFLELLGVEHVKKMLLSIEHLEVFKVAKQASLLDYVKGEKQIDN